SYGVGPQGVLLPTFWRYPGQTTCHGVQLTDGHILYEFNQSDEGGRFIRHVTQYQIVEIEDHTDLRPGQFWVTESQLRNLLRTSNLIGLSLRIVLSAQLNRFL
ncbi:MAG TPA: hypothetical protein DCE78_06665, partial [Bacteroidetes bacterium]|nr:hypothetical protein [Bacteroidota bacterium]